MRVCIDCPSCNSEECFQCTDLFGSNAFSEGGVFGRADGIFISIEAQKSSGGLHAHGQFHVQCMHWHRPLMEILELLSAGTDAVTHSISKEYLAYKSHVCRQWYEDLSGWQRRQRQTEEEWPEYRTTWSLLSSLKHLFSSILDPVSWRDAYLKDHVQPVQEMKQNHVHTVNAKGE